MTQEFVPYELASRMKQLGFDELCFAYFKDEEFQYPNPYEPFKNSEQKSWFVTAPLYQQAFRWFRKRCSIHCEITQTTDWEEDNESWNFVIYKYRLGNNDGMKDSDVDFNTYEEAELECLEKLIEIVENK
jgi:hypothetical protein